MIAEMDEGRIGTIIVKDMSRPGRDYLKVGYYTEVAFPDADVRFIAVNNGVDSANQQKSDFTPFLNIINEWYAKDTSKKIRAVFKAKGESGKPLCTNPPYGYIKDPCCLSLSHQEYLFPYKAQATIRGARYPTRRTVP
jgi:site-specific DNA recombinase